MYTIYPFPYQTFNPSPSLYKSFQYLESSEKKKIQKLSSLKQPQPLQHQITSFSNKYKITLFTNNFNNEVVEFCFKNNKTCKAYNFKTRKVIVTQETLNIDKVVNNGPLNFLAISTSRNSNFESNLLVDQNFDRLSLSRARKTDPTNNVAISILSKMDDNLKFKISNLKTAIKAAKNSNPPKFLDSSFTIDNKVHLFHTGAEFLDDNGEVIGKRTSTGRLFMAVICESFDFDPKFVEDNTDPDERETASSKQNLNLNYELNSYTEIELKCNIASINNNQPISVTHLLATNEIIVLYEDNNLCKFSLNRIKQKMYNTWLHCIKGSSGNSKIIPWIQTSKSDKCWRRPASASEHLISDNDHFSNFCSDFKVIYQRTPLFQTANPAEQQLSQMDLKTFLPPGSKKITSIISSNRKDQIVILGTDAGELFKFSFDGNRILKSSNSQSNWHLGRDFTSIINGQVSNNGDLFAYSRKGFLLIPLDDCSKFKTCQECAKSDETSCGWCVLEGKCVAQKKCLNEVLNPENNVGNCPNFKSFRPDSFSSQDNHVEFEIEAYIPGSFKYKCLLTNSKNQTTQVNAIEKDNTPQTRKLSCNFKEPGLNLIDKILNPNKQIQKLKLALAYENKKIQISTIIAEREISVYNCLKFYSCTECVRRSSKDQVPYVCYWSNLDNKCSKTGNDFKYRNTKIIDKQQDCSYLKLKNSPNLPNFLGKPVQLPSLPNNTIHQKLEFTLINDFLKDGVDDKKYNFKYIATISKKNIVSRCDLNERSRVLTCEINKKLTIEKTETDPMSPNVFSKDFSLSIKRQDDGLNSYTIEPQFIQTIYECSASKSCGECLYNSNLVTAQCGWCSKTNTCSIRSESQCKNEKFEQQTCPSPRILDFWPKIGVVSGGAEVKIIGKDIPFISSELEIKIGDVVCSEPKVEFIKSKRHFLATCVTGENKEGQEQDQEYEQGQEQVQEKTTPNSAYVKIYSSLPLAGHKSIVAVSAEKYQFVRPVISEISPNHAPKSGGVVLTLKGQYLNLAKNPKINLKIQGRHSGSSIQACYFIENSVASDGSSLKCRIENVQKSGRNSNSGENSYDNDNSQSSSPSKQKPAQNYEVKCEFRDKEAHKIEFAEIQMHVFNEIVKPAGHLALKKDPCVEEIMPNWSISEGGMNISVIGQGFRNGKDYFMINPNEEDRYFDLWASENKNPLTNAYSISKPKQPCIVIDNEEIICHSPAASSLDPSSHFQREINFEFDGTRFSTGGLNLNYYPSPEIFTQESEYRITLKSEDSKGQDQDSSETSSTSLNLVEPQKGESSTAAIVITGKNICSFAAKAKNTHNTDGTTSMTDCKLAAQYLAVRIGEKYAKIKAVTTDTITCYPPIDLEDGNYDIFVELGVNYQRLAGKLEYKTGATIFTPEIILYSAIALLLFIILMTFLFCYQHSKVKSVEKDKKTLQDQIMNDQSKKIAAEQSTMFQILVDDNKSLNDGFEDCDTMAQDHCFRDYALKVLFKRENYLRYAKVLMSDNYNFLNKNQKKSVDSSLKSRGNTLNHHHQGHQHSDSNGTGTLKSIHTPMGSLIDRDTGNDTLEYGQGQTHQGLQGAISHNQQLKLSTLDELYNCLDNEQFLTSVIKVLDNNLSAEEKSNISAFIVIIFCDKFDYLTDILMSNLSSLVNKSLEFKQERAFLRQSQSVFEKMVNHWIGLLMYPYLKQNVSKPLYHLYRSLRDTVFKGPVDCMTGQARYTLSQESQLRTQICDKELNPIKNFLINVIENTSAEDSIKVKVLSCDTITQVKYKIILKFYGPTWSYRPQIDDFALFYLGDQGSGSATPIELLDRDTTSYIDASGYRKINTLSHYKLTKENLKFAIVNKNTANLNYESLLRATGGNSHSQSNDFMAEILHKELGPSAASFTLPPPPIFPPARVEQDTNTCNIPNMSSLPRKVNGNGSLITKNTSYGDETNSLINNNPEMQKRHQTSTSLLSRISNFVIPDEISRDSNNYTHTHTQPRTTHTHLPHESMSLTMPRNAGSAKKMPVSNNHNSQGNSLHQSIHEHKPSLLSNQYSSRHQSSMSINQGNGNQGSQSNGNSLSTLQIARGIAEGGRENSNSNQTQVTQQSTTADGLVLGGTSGTGKTLHTTSTHNYNTQSNSKDDVDTGIGTLSEKGIYHLVKPNTDKYHVEKTFTPILHTKHKVSSETNSLFQAILCRIGIKNATLGRPDEGSALLGKSSQNANNGNNQNRQLDLNIPEVPLCLKFLFRFFDEIANNHGIEEDVVHIWKTNSLVLRFWMDIISEPTTLLDVDLLPPVQSSMRIIASALMEACSTSRYEYTVDTPQNKLLYHGEITNSWNSWVNEFFSFITEDTEEKPFDYKDSLRQFKEELDYLSVNEFEARRETGILFNNKAALSEILPFILKYWAFFGVFGDF